MAFRLARERSGSHELMQTNPRFDASLIFGRLVCEVDASDIGGSR